MASEPLSKQVKLAESAGVAESKSNQNGDNLISIVDVQDVFSLVIGYIDDNIKLLFALELVCKKYQSGFCWSMVQRLDLHKLLRLIVIATNSKQKMRIKQRILSNGSRINSLLLAKLESYRFLEPFHEEITDTFAPQLTEVSAFYMPTQADFFDKLDPSRLLHLGVSISGHDDLQKIRLERFKCLKSLDIMFYLPWHQLEAAMQPIASWNLNRLEEIKISFGGALCAVGPSAPVFQTVLNIAQTYRATLKRFYLSRWEELLEVLLTREKIPDNCVDWSVIEEVVKAGFGLPISALHRTGHSMLQFCISRHEKTPHAKFTSRLAENFQRCYGKNRSSEAIRLLCTWSPVRDFRSDTWMDFWLSKVSGWLEDTYSFTLADMSDLSHICDSLNRLLEILGETGQTEPPALLAIYSYLRQLIDYWPKEATNSVICLTVHPRQSFSGRILARLVATGREWAQRVRSLDLSKLFSRNSVAFFEDTQSFNILVLVAGDQPFQNCCEAFHLMGTRTAECRTKTLRTFMRSFRQYPHLLHEMLSSNLDLEWDWCFDTAEDLGSLLLACSVDENLVGALFQYFLTDHFMPCSQVAQAIGTISDEIASPEELDSIKFALWKVKLESCKGEQARPTHELQQALHDLLTNFPDIPTRINAWMNGGPRTKLAGIQLAPPLKLAHVRKWLALWRRGEGIPQPDCD